MLSDWEKSVANFPIPAAALPSGVRKGKSQMSPDTYERLGLIRRMYDVSSNDASGDTLVDEGPCAVLRSRNCLPLGVHGICRDVHAGVPRPECGQVLPRIRSTRKCDRISSITLIEWIESGGVECLNERVCDAEHFRVIFPRVRLLYSDLIDTFQRL